MADGGGGGVGWGGPKAPDLEKSRELTLNTHPHTHTRESITHAMNNISRVNAEPLWKSYLNNECIPHTLKSQ